MRYAMAGLVLALAAVPAAHAQQTSIANPTLPPTTELQTLPELITEVRTSGPAQAQLQTVEIRPIATDGQSAEPISARSVLAIIGGVLVVAALIALFS